MNKILSKVLALMLMLSAQPAFAAYSYYRTITLEADQVPSTQTNFTVLVCANSVAPCNASVAGLNQSGAGAHVTQADADDLVFGTNNTCSNLLNWEIELYVAATGELIAWVEISSLDGTTDTVIYMCYGDSGVTTFQGGTTGSAWDANTKGVWHLPNGSSLTANDTSASGHNGTVNGTVAAAAGKLDGGASFAGGTSDYISVADSTDYNGTALTLSAWVKLTDANINQIIDRDDVSTREFQFRVNAGAIEGIFFTEAGAKTATGATTTVNNGSWHFVVATWDDSTSDAIVYLDGSQDGISDSSGPALNSGSGVVLWIGKSNAVDTQMFNGTIDEPRIANVARSADWITTEYNSQSAPGTFVTFGTETAAGGSTRQPCCLLGVF